MSHTMLSWSANDNQLVVPVQLDLLFTGSKREESKNSHDYIQNICNKDQSMVGW